MRRVGQGAVFLVLLVMSLSIPLMIEAIFPGGRSSDALPPEEPVTTAPVSAATERQRVADNVAWLRGESGSILATEAVSADDAAPDEPDADEITGDEPTDASEAAVTWDRRPGVFAGYTRSWDSLNIRREQWSAGVFVYFSSHTRVQAAGARLRFRDDADRIDGRAVRLDGAHRLSSDWILEEGLEWDRYDHAHESWNGDARLSGGLTSKLNLVLDAGRRDVWERLPNIRDRLRLWQAGLGLFYELLPRWWLAASGNTGWYTDHNVRLSAGAEAGHVLSPRWGLSAALGLEATAFREQRETYWSPSYYHNLYGRLRLSRGYESGPFEPQRPFTGWRNRWGYLAEVTGGVTDNGQPEVSERVGLAVHATSAVTVETEFFHLGSEGRFNDSDYSERRWDLRGEVRF